MKALRTLTAAAVALSSLAGPANAMAGRHPIFHRSDAVTTAGWLNTRTLGGVPTGGLDMGPAAASMPMTVVVSLVPSNKAGAESYVKHEYTPGDSLFHHFLTPAQFATAYGPTVAEVSAAENYLASEGFKNISASPNRDLVRAEGTAAIVSQAFNTSIHTFNQNGRAVYANVTAAQVPAALGSVVQSVLGLHNVPAHLDLAYPRGHRASLHRASSHRHLDAQTCAAPTDPVTGTCATREFDTTDLRKVYDDNGAPTASNTNIAIMSIGDLNGVIRDLRYNEAYNGLRQVPVTVVPVDYQSIEEYGTVEFDMDSQTSTGIAGDVNHLYFYNMGELYESEIAEDFNHWVNDDIAQVASASFGECEFQAALDGGMLAEDFILLQAVAQGQTLFASSGDAGSTCGLTLVTNGTVPGDGPPQVEYPATSPWVMGAGGTTLFANASGGYAGEISWASGGGGVSFFEAPPFWTEGVSPGSLPVYDTIAGPGLFPLAGYDSGRTVPDVAMDADANVSAALFYQGGSLGGNGGTSLASPLAAGVFARLQSRHNNTLGNAGPALYGNYLFMGGGLGTVAAPPAGQITGAIGGFHDVVLGANGAFNALPGYDMNTGMGSFDINRTIVAFGS